MASTRSSVDEGPEARRKGDAELLEQDIVYEARTDHAVRQILGAVQAAFAEHGGLVDLAQRRLVGRCDDVVARCVETGAPAADVGLALRAVLADYSDAARVEASLATALEVTRKLYDSALEDHAARTQRMLRWLKRESSKSLALQRVASDSEKRAVEEAHAAETLEAVAVSALVHADRAAAVKAVAAVHQAESTDSFVSCERALRVAQAQLDRAVVTNRSLKAELAMFVDVRSESSDDMVVKLFKHFEDLLLSTGDERSILHEAGLLTRLDKRALAQHSHLAAHAEDWRESDLESVASNESAVGIPEEGLRLLKAELLQLRIAVNAAQREAQDSDRKFQQQYYAHMELKQQHTALEGRLKDSASKNSKLKHENKRAVKHVFDLEHKVADAVKSTDAAHPLTRAMTPAALRRASTPRRTQTAPAQARLGDKAPSMPIIRQAADALTLRAVDARPSHTIDAQADVPALDERPTTAQTASSPASSHRIVGFDDESHRALDSRPGTAQTTSSALLFEAPPPLEVPVEAPPPVEAPVEAPEAPARRKPRAHAAAPAAAPSEAAAAAAYEAVLREAVLPSFGDFSSRASSPADLEARPHSPAAPPPTVLPRSGPSASSISLASLESVASKLRADLHRESRSTAQATAKAESLRAERETLRRRVATLELVLTEKNALLFEITRVAKTQRGAAIQAQAALEDLEAAVSAEPLAPMRRSVQMRHSLYVLADAPNGLAHAPNARKSSAAPGILASPSRGILGSRSTGILASKSTSALGRKSSPDVYQKGATRCTTPLLEPVTGSLAQVGAPYRAAAPQHAPAPSLLTALLRSSGSYALPASAL
ncbi:hypothetical protein M885DRAFT_509611 [Pelagophyceae sp. CCMP2097]|nr:hypothetical protein M885DRAFT_509611 [Pelagophyceae sp. CCMP2097]